MWRDWEIAEIEGEASALGGSTEDLVAAPAGS
jgi:hypothetical protein